MKFASMIRSGSGALSGQLSDWKWYNYLKNENPQTVKDRLKTGQGDWAGRLKTPGSLFELDILPARDVLRIQKTALPLTDDDAELLKGAFVGLERVFRRVWSFEVEDSSRAGFTKALTAEGYDKIAAEALTEFFVDGVLSNVVALAPPGAVVPRMVHSSGTEGGTGAEQVSAPQKEEPAEDSNTLLIVFLVSGGVLLVAVGVFFALFCLCQTASSGAGAESPLRSRPRRRSPPESVASVAVDGDVDEEGETLIAGGEDAAQSQAGGIAGGHQAQGDVAALV